MENEDKELKKSARTLVVLPVLKGQWYDPKFKLEEAVGLAGAIDLQVIKAEAVELKNPKPGTLLGMGKIEEYHDLVKAEKLELVYIDSKLSPTQQRNLEEKLNCKVIDRSGLILEIFGDRARTKEGKLQVELAALEYQKTRVVRGWTHLERQRGGFGFVGGPGEKQIELDKRMINLRINKIKKELEKVVNTRKLHRKPRQEKPHAVIGLVGYTNAGKSTLFNRLTGADVMAEDMLFATLDPTMRVLKLPSGRKVILSDTVGFISDLPTELIAAFRATLEEVIEADFLLHVRDISHPETNLQRDNVVETLHGLGLEPKMEKRCFEVLNKIDLAKEKPKGDLQISALNGDGVEELLEWLDKKLADLNLTKEYRLEMQDSRALAWLYEHGNVQSREEVDGEIVVRVNMSSQDAQKFEKECGFKS